MNQNFSAMVNVRDPNAPVCLRHPYQVLDASDADGPKVCVMPGLHWDSMVGEALTPTINGQELDADSPPLLTVSGADTRIVFKLTVKSLDGYFDFDQPSSQQPGAIQKVEIIAAAIIPPNTNTEQYFLCDLIEVNTFAPSVKPKKVGVSGSQMVLIGLGGGMYSVQM